MNKGIYKQSCLACVWWNPVCKNPARKAKWDNKQICPGYKERVNVRLY